MRHGEGLLPERAGAPDRIEGKLKGFPDEISDGCDTQIRAQTAQPGVGCRRAVSRRSERRHRKNRYLTSAATAKMSTRRMTMWITPIPHIPPPIMSCIILSFLSSARLTVVN